MLDDTVAIIDPVNHPRHYGKGRFGVECIAITRHMTFNAGNAFKYIWRFAEKNGLEDLAKAIVYLRWADEDVIPAILPGPHGVVHMLMERHVFPNIRVDEPYYALGLVAHNRFGLAIKHVEGCIEHLERITSP